jgi:hypothetical protein
MERKKYQKEKHSLPLAKEEWNFSECPNNELRHCWDYEFAREVDWIKKEYYEDKKNSEKAFDKDGWWLSNYGEHPPYVLYLADGFPDVPYLKTKRRKSQKDYSYLFSPILEIDDDSNKRKPSTILRRSPSITTHSFAIDWSYSDKKITDSFKEWLEDIKNKATRPYPPHEARGKGGKTLRRELKALGLYRLIRHYSSVREAMERHSYDDLDKKKKQQAYADEADWREAQSLVKKILKEHFQILL